MFRGLLTLLLVSEVAAATPPAQTEPLAGVGRPADRQLIERIDISVLPNGTGLPKGKGTARDGAKVYAAHCAACHGDKGEGRGDFIAVAGGRGTLASAQPLLTVGSYWPYATTLFDYIRRAMPYASPGSLTTDEIYAVSAWVLHANDIIPEDFVLNQKTLPAVRMPNRDGFISDPRPDVPPPAR